MATVNFSVPEDIKRRFNRTFKGRNKSAVIARLMEQGIEEEARHRRHQHAMDELLKLRKRIPPITDEEFRQARSEGGLERSADRLKRHHQVGFPLARRSGCRGSDETP